jgi:hypothetical protein
VFPFETPLQTSCPRNTRERSNIYCREKENKNEKIDANKEGKEGQLEATVLKRRGR